MKKTNIAIWLRTFRPPLQHAYERLDETGDDGELDDLAALLRRADERRERDAPSTDNRKSPSP